MNFEWSLFEFTRNDCTNLSKAIKASKVLTTMRLHRSQVDDVKGRVLVSHLLDHPTLTTLGSYGTQYTNTPTRMHACT